ncbi:hypothetical protein JZ751_029189 [Albula glossodonta]|uniref:Myb/SANT-like DNA-binding domain-containing protein n=1 Tax=Albula glossodonta TaxID=121402 RepID=A0A8T2PGW3_9TELE|nr:hypothetical protein JZ751_029189 [Albula glossodonta]
MDLQYIDNQQTGLGATRGENSASKVPESRATVEIRTKDCVGGKEYDNGAPKRNEGKPSHRYNCLNCGTNFLGNWLDWETRELLQIRAEEEINARMSGTVRDAAVYATIAEMLAERGIVRSKKQVQSKLKCMKLQFKKMSHRSNRNGRDGKEWPFLRLCDAIWGNRSTSDAVPVASLPSQDQGTPTASPESPPDQAAHDDIQVHSLPEVRLTGDRALKSDSDLDEVQLEGESPSIAPQGQASEAKRGEGGRFTRRSAKKTKMEQAAGVMCGILMDRLEALEEKREAREERRLREEREFQLRLHQEALDTQFRILTEMKSAQAHFVQQLQQLLSRFSQTQQLQQQQPSSQSGAPPCSRAADPSIQEDPKQGT